MRNESGTIAAISTAMSNSGIGIVRMSGEEAVEIAERIYKGKNESGNQSINSASVNPTADPIASTSNASDSRHRILLFHDLEINQTVREVHKNGQLLDLTETEYSMLELLVANRHQTFSAQRLFESVWQEPYYYGANNTVTVHIRNLRSKVEDNPGNPELIKTVWGKGYRCD